MSCTICTLSDYELGLVFIVSVCIIWGLGAALVQVMYTDYDFDSPFLVTYVGSSLFIGLIPLKWWLDRVPTHDRLSMCTEFATTMEDISRCQPIISTATKRRPPPSAILSDEMQSEYIKSQCEPSEGDVPLYAHKVESEEQENWTTRQHFMVAIQIAPVWFITNWAFNVALSMTSIASTTVLVSTSSVFVLIAATMAKDEEYTAYKVAGVIFSIAGSALTGYHDSKVNQNNEGMENGGLIGDCCAIVAAIGYGVYAMQVRLLCPRNESSYSMQLLLGFIGLFNIVSLSPIAIWKATQQSEWSVLIVILILFRGFTDYVLAEYLYFRAVVLTSATVASVGLGLAVPVAFAVDIIMGKPDIWSFASIFGALAVITGFLLVNVGTMSEVAPPKCAECENVKCTCTDLDDEDQDVYVRA